MTTGLLIAIILCLIPIVIAYYHTLGTQIIQQSEQIELVKKEISAVFMMRKNDCLLFISGSTKIKIAAPKTEFDDNLVKGETYKLSNDDGNITIIKQELI
jgi:hypothetical protein